MQISDKMRKILAKHNIKPKTFHKRIKDGWSVERALKTPTQYSKINTTSSYTIRNDQDKIVAQIGGAQQVAFYLTRKLKYTVTKNQIVGRFWRHPEKSHVFGKYSVTKE